MIPLGQLITGLIKLGRPGCAGNKATLPHTIQPCFGAKEGHLMMCFPTSELPHTPTRLTHTKLIFRKNGIVGIVGWNTAGVAI